VAGTAPKLKLLRLELSLVEALLTVFQLFLAFYFILL